MNLHEEYSLCAVPFEFLPGQQEFHIRELIMIVKTIGDEWKYSIDEE
jgi:hypothetical protein